METKSGVNYEKRLKKLKPWDRFDYLRRYQTKQLKEKGEDTKHLEIAKLRRKLNLSVNDIRALQGGSLDMDTFISLSELVGEDIGVLISDYEDKFPKAKPKKSAKAADQAAKKLIDKAEASSNARKSKKLGFDLVFENHCLSHLSLHVSGNVVKIYENHEAPPAAKTVLIGKSTFTLGGKDSVRIFPEKVKI